MYRAMAASDVDKFPEEDDNVADIMGAIKYIHTEIIVEHALPPSRTVRRYRIDSIKKARHKVLNPPGLQQGTGEYKNFGPFLAYDSGRATGGMSPAIKQYGDFVGVQNQGADPRLAWPQDK